MVAENPEPIKETKKSKGWKDRIGWPWSVDRWLAIIFFVLGTAVSWYFYDLSIQRPQLTIVVNSIKSEFQRPDDPHFTFDYDGKPITGNAITAMQVAVWNAGTAPIKADDVLEPIRIQVSNSCPVVAMVVKKISRKACQFEASVSLEERQQGQIPLKWKILEPGDGAIIEIVYSGDAHQTATLVGTIEGQKELRNITDLPNATPADLRNVMYLGIFTGMISASIISIIIIARKRRIVESYHKGMFLACLVVLPMWR